MPKSPENQDSSPMLTSSEIGALPPDVPRTADTLREAPKPVEARILDENGNPIVYLPEAVGEFSPDTQIVKIGDRAKRPFIFKGRTKDGKAVLETEDEEGVTIAPRELEASYERSHRVYSEWTKEGKEIKLDMEEVLRDSVGFYTAHNLKDFLKELPKEVRLSAQSEMKLREALREGFDKAMLLPSTDLQTANIEKLVAETATKEVPHLQPNEQYTAPYFESGTKTSQARNRPQRKAYLLLYQSGPLPEETMGNNPNDLDQLFSQKKWNGLTLQEYLLLQRKEAEARKDHSFDAYDGDAKKSQWTWFLDSRLPAKARAGAAAGVPDGVVHAFWFPGLRQVEVAWYEPGFSRSELGARPAVVVEIEV